MASKTTMSTSMNGGEGKNSYYRNSSFQGRAQEGVKGLIENVINENFDVDFDSSSSNVIKVADYGCSTGPNTFGAMKNIIELIKQKYPQLPLQFQVFFNDHVSNDFNTLFKATPSDRDYFVAGVPGPFHGPLFPKSSLNFIYSSFSLQWLSNSPKELVDKDSIAYNKGRIYHVNAPNEVFHAYSKQFAKDINSFLSVRKQELAHGGMMALLIPCLPDGVQQWQCHINLKIMLLEACLLDMAKEGLVSETMVDSFNIPMYHSTQNELKALMENHDSLRVVRMEPIMVERKNEQYDSQTAVKDFRAVMEGIFSDHFGSGIIDEFFDRAERKMKCIINSGYETIIMCVFLKHR